MNEAQDAGAEGEPTIPYLFKIVDGGGQVLAAMRTDGTTEINPGYPDYLPLRLLWQRELNDLALKLQGALSPRQMGRSSRVP